MFLGRTANVDSLTDPSLSPFSPCHAAAVVQGSTLLDEWLRPAMERSVGRRGSGCDGGAWGFPGQEVTSLLLELVMQHHFHEQVSQSSFQQVRN